MAGGLNAFVGLLGESLSCIDLLARTNISAHYLTSLGRTKFFIVNVSIVDDLILFVNSSASTYRNAKKLELKAPSIHFQR